MSAAALLGRVSWWEDRFGVLWATIIRGVLSVHIYFQATLSGQLCFHRLLLWKNFHFTLGK